MGRGSGRPCGSGRYSSSIRSGHSSHLEQEVGQAPDREAQAQRQVTHSGTSTAVIAAGAHSGM